jgi:hypothetical protein
LGYDELREGKQRCDPFCYIAIYFNVFLVMHRMFRRWWYGLVGAVTAVILTLAPLLAAFLLVGLNLAILRDVRIL